ncbi:MAG TPA: inositol monophosphatase family protein [Acidimicrobiales bacterium]|nr:inositol monophosphatase family protein [Acidimicrobiales bacterium]
MSAEAVLEVAIDAARRGGELLMEHRRRGVSGVMTKTSNTDLVSDADRAAEKLIVGLIAESFPDDGIVGEEGASTEGTSGRRWIVDPLDGTTNFVYGFDAFCVSVGVEDESGPFVGCVHDPSRGETFSAVRGGGADLDGERIQPTTASDLAQALVGTGFSYRSDQREWQAAVVSHLLPRVRDIRRVGSAALDLCWVATGRLDAHVERGLAPWDHAAGALIAAEAGASIFRPSPTAVWGLVMAAAPGIAVELFNLVGAAEQLAGPRPE